MYRADNRWNLWTRWLRWRSKGKLSVAQCPCRYQGTCYELEPVSSFILDCVQVDVHLIDDDEPTAEILRPVDCDYLTIDELRDLIAMSIKALEYMEKLNRCSNR